MGGEFYKVWGAGLIALTVALAIGIGINEVTHSRTSRRKCLQGRRT
jgi:hypothetical protein